MKTAHAATLGTFLVLLACCSPSPRSPAPFRALDATSGQTSGPSAVDEHAVRGAAIRDAVERGDLKGTKESAIALIAYVTKYETPTPESRLEAMVAAAHRVAAAQDLHEAAHSFAFLAERCGECHVKIGGPASGPSMPPADSLGVVPRMRRHHWAAARLWEGLVAPSDEAWKSGAAVLADAPMKAEGRPGQTTVPEVDKLAASVHDLGVRATTSTKASSRIEIYGDLLDTCAMCHQRTRGGAF